MSTTVIEQMDDRLTRRIAMCRDRREATGDPKWAAAAEASEQSLRWLREGSRD